MIKINNPGNIRISDTKWQGKVVPSSDPSFETFQAPEWGIRAIAKIILEDGIKGINTIHAIISRYAPPTENNTDAYEKAVAEHLKVNIDDVLDVDDYRTMYALVVAIILHENGSQPYSDDIINKGLALAGIYNTPPLALYKQPEPHVMGAVATVGALGAATQAISPALPLAQQLLSIAPWVVYCILFGVFVYLGWILYKKHTTGV